LGKDKPSNRIQKDRENLLVGLGAPEPKPLVPDEFQLEAIRLLNAQHDVLVVAPTGAGKTYIAIEAIREVIERGGRAVYTTPLKALSNSKYTDFKRRFEPQYSVGLLTGERKIEGDAQIVVATTEIYRNELYSPDTEYQLVVLDEFHYLSDPQRGPVWEESVILSPGGSTLLMLSASISNAEEIAEWITSVRKRELSIVREEERPVALRLAFLHPEHGVVPLAGDDGRLTSEVYRFYKAGGRRGQGHRFRRKRRRGS